MYQATVYARRDSAERIQMTFCEANLHSACARVVTHRADRGGVD